MIRMGLDTSYKRINRTPRSPSLCNHLSFDDLPNMNYLYGYIAGDGAIRALHNTVGIYDYVYLASSDLQIITNIHNFLQPTGKISSYQPKNGKLSYRIQITDETFVNLC